MTYLIIMKTAIGIQINNSRAALNLSTEKSCVVISFII